MSAETYLSEDSSQGFSNDNNVVAEIVNEDSNSQLVTYKEYYIRSFVRIFAILASVYGMVISWDGWMGLTYFTKLSNVMICVALAGSQFFDTRSVLKSRALNEQLGWKDNKSNAWYVFKFMMTISITVTFSLYLCFLAPTDKAGFVQAYMQSGAHSLCVHFIAPLLAIADFLLFDYRFRSSKTHVYYSVIPPLSYVAYVVALAQISGVRWGEHAMQAPYNFLNYGSPAGWFGFAPSTVNSTTVGVGVAYLLVILTLIFVVLGRVFLALKDSRAKKCGC